MRLTKRFRDSISLEDSVEEDIDTDVLEDIEADAMAVEDEVEDEVESSDSGTIEVEEGLQDIYDYVIEIPLLRIEDIKTRQKELGSRSLIADGERASLLNQVASLERSNARLRGTMMMERARADRFRQRVRFMESELRQIHRFCYYDRMRFRRLKTFAAKRLEHDYHSFCDIDNGNGANGDGENRNGGNENPNENNRDARHVTRECTYQDFMKCQPLNFKGIEGVVELIRWFEKMEKVFHISNCPEKYQVKYATCTLLNSALTWWNSHKRTIRAEAAFSMP
ncbi:hypothetical protein Tco_0833904 [Tanacetum coccineum]